MAPFRSRRLAATFGVELTGEQLKDNLTEDNVSMLIRLVAEHSLVLFRDQDVSDADQDRITEALGKQRDQSQNIFAPPPDPNAKPGDKHEIFGYIPLLNKGTHLLFLNGPGLCEGDDDPTAVYEAEDDNYKGGSSCWHTAETDKFDVELVNILYPTVVPENKGHTLFSDTATAFADLPEETQQTFEQLRLIHALKLLPEMLERFPTAPSIQPVSQALVKQCPVTGRKFLYTSFNEMDRVIGCSREASRETLKFLFDHLIQPKYIYDHKWRAGDLIIWNCNGTMHKRGELDPSCPRVLRRTQTAVPALQSTRDWDKSRVPNPGDHDGQIWNPYPFRD
jgi:alpha-ketoglutarate-dependent taurine dioxygenase